MPDLLNLGARVNPEGAQTGLRAVRQSLDRTERHVRGHAERSARHFDRMTRQIRMVQGAIAALGGAAALRGLQRMLGQALETADAVDKMSTRIGVSTKLLQEWQFAAARAAGVSENTANMALQRLSRRLGEAANDTGELNDTLKQYGIEVRNADGSQRQFRDVLGDIADAIANASSEQEQLRIAFKAFDSEGAAMVNVLKEGREGFEELVRQAHELGVVLDEEAIASAVEAKDALTDLERSTTTLKNELVLELAPGLTEISRGLLEVTKDARELRKELEGITGGNVAEIVGNLLRGNPATGPLALLVDWIRSRGQAAQQEEVKATIRNARPGAAGGGGGLLPPGPAGPKNRELLNLLAARRGEGFGTGFMVGATGEPGDMGGGFQERSRQAAVAEARAAIATYERIREAAEAIRSEAVDAELEARRRRRELFGTVRPEAREAQRTGELLMAGRGAMAGIEGGFEAHIGTGVLSSFANEVIDNTETIRENTDRWDEAGRIVLDFGQQVAEAAGRLGDFAREVGERLLGRAGKAGGIVQAGIQGGAQGGPQGAAGAAIAEWIATSKTFRKFVAQLDMLVELSQQVLEPLSSALTELAIWMEGWTRFFGSILKPLLQAISDVLTPVLKALNYLLATFLGFFGIKVNREALEAAQAVTEPEVVELRLDASAAMGELQRARDQLLASGDDVERELARQRFLAARETAILAEQRARSTPEEQGLPDLEANLFASVGKFIERIVGQVMDFMQHVLGQFATWLNGILQPVLGSISDFLRGLGGVLTDIGEVVFGTIRDALRRAFDVKISLPSGGRGTIEKALGIDFPWVSFAGGGLVGGAWNGRQGPAGDTVPAMLTPGEFVLPRGVAERIGVDDLQRAMESAGLRGQGLVTPGVRHYGWWDDVKDTIDDVVDDVKDAIDKITGNALFGVVEDRWRGIVRDHRDDLFARIADARGFALGSNLVPGGLSMLHPMEAVLPSTMNPASPRFDVEAFWRPAVAALANMAPAGGGGDGANVVVVVVDDQGREVRRSTDPGEFARGTLLPGLRWAERNGYTDKVTRQ